jgi:hypothetical protein
MGFRIAMQQQQGGSAAADPRSNDGLAGLEIALIEAFEHAAAPFHLTLSPPIAGFFLITEIWNNPWMRSSSLQCCIAALVLPDRRHVDHMSIEAKDRGQHSG